MKKIFMKISFLMSSFIIGIQSKVFGREMPSTLYGPPTPANNDTIPFDPSLFEDTNTVVNPQTKYGAPSPIVNRPNNNINNTSGLGHAQILSIIIAILLFVIGLVIVLNKGIKRNIKAILLTIISIAIVVLMLLTMFVF